MHRRRHPKRRGKRSIQHSIPRVNTARRGALGGGRAADRPPCRRHYPASSPPMAAVRVAAAQISSEGVVCVPLSVYMDFETRDGSTDDLDQERSRTRSACGGRRYRRSRARCAEDDSDPSTPQAKSAAPTSKKMIAAAMPPPMITAPIASQNFASTERSNMSPAWDANRGRSRRAIRGLPPDAPPPGSGREQPEQQRGHHRQEAEDQDRRENPCVVASEADQRGREAQLDDPDSSGRDGNAAQDARKRPGGECLGDRDLIRR